MSAKSAGSTIDVDVAETLELAELAQLQRGERGLQWAAPADDEDLLDAAVVQRLQRVVGDVGRRQARRDR